MKRAKTNRAEPKYFLLQPERIQLPAEYDVRADVWSLGITLVQLARGRNPYLGANKDNTTHFELLLLIRDGAPPTLTADEDFSAEFREFVDACLKKDPAVRPKYNELMVRVALGNVF